LPVPGIVVKAKGRKIGTQIAKTVVLGTGFGLEESIGLSDVVNSSEKDAYLPCVLRVTQGLCSECAGRIWQPIPEYFRSCSYIQQVER
jgi:hypothetical protein